MKIRHAAALAMLAGLGMGGAAIQALHAQAKPPGILVVDITAITDPKGFKAIGQRTNEAAAAVFKEHGGHYLARTSKITAIDGNAPNRFVLISFDSVEKAKAWYNSAAQKDVNALRIKTTNSRAFVVEGM